MEYNEAESVEKIFDVRAVCELLGSPRGTVIRLIWEGKLRAHKFPDGRLWRIRESDLRAFIDSLEDWELE
jgi:excisionase family DNA binding protein